MTKSAPQAPKIAKYGAADANFSSDKYPKEKKKQIFYYNKVTRVSQWEKPIDFKKDPKRLVKDVNFGLHFYH